MLTFQAADILRKLKKAQIIEDNKVFLNDCFWVLCTVREEGEPHVSIKIDNYKHSIFPIFDYLKAEGLIETHDIHSQYIQVKHKGWHLWQFRFAEFISFLTKSIIIPCAIAFITALLTVLVTLWLNGRLG